ncbi:MAG: hypothetical protein ACRDE7_10765, partial [Sphingobacterium sp.]
IGCKKKWDNTRYLMFTVTVESNQNTISGDRKFLLDKKSGDIRFEGTLNKENIVVLFNKNNATIKKVYDQQGTELPQEKYKDQVRTLIDQYTIDLKILSLPASITGATLNTKSESKIINAEKLQMLEFSNFNGTNGNIYVNQETGLIKQIDLNNKSYAVNGYKDIGNGLIFPTVFKSVSDSIVYQQVASFIDMELKKLEEF